MNPGRSRTPACRYGFPCVSGDEPVACVGRPNRSVFSLRERGSARLFDVAGDLLDVFPAWAGMNRAATQQPREAACFPRVSGEERYRPTGGQDHDVFPV